MAAVGPSANGDAKGTSGAAEYIRQCPTCGAANPPEVIRCACGAMLAGVDLVRKGMRPAPPGAAVEAVVMKPTTVDGAPVVCPHADCAQPNPPGSVVCLTCNRSLTTTEPTAFSAGGPGLIALPGALEDRYRIVSMLPAKGAEAELLIVQPVSGGAERVAKIYRHGIAPKREVQERIARIESTHLVQVFEAGVSDGYAYEVMEFCAHGSLRERLDAAGAARIEGAAAPDSIGATVHAMVSELAAAIANVHAAGLVHRDLKPENVLVRSEDPLRLVLTDFSIASTLDATQRFTSAARTLPYASPESLSGVIDGKSDYWALGMIVVEAALGRHPFAGLSEAVILHHLTTRSVDVTGITDRNVRKLTRGLLLRDPETRWGAGQVERWLAGDESLGEPIDARPATGFGEPYRLGDDVCETSEQLAVALARNWKAGIADLGNGQLMAWFRNVQKDQNVVRLLIELNFERKVHVDLQLLQLILHLAPGIPPTWRGESVELQAILDRATLALNGDKDAGQWLHALYQHRVLEIYAKAGNPQAADVVKRWNDACDRFEDASDRMLAVIRRRKGPARTASGAVVDIAAASYGVDEHMRPPLSSLHAQLLAVTYDASWAERLRRRLQGELATLIPRCPWLVDAGDPAQMDAMSLLVLESLLPEARLAAEREVKAEVQRKEQESVEVLEMRAGFDAIVADLRASARGSISTDAKRDDMHDALDRYFALVLAIRASGRSDEAWVELRNTVFRREPVVKRMQVLLDQLEERQAISSGWLSRQVMIVLSLVSLVGLRFLGPRFLLGLLLLGVGVAAWRLVPPLFLMRDLRMLSNKL